MKQIIYTTLVLSGMLIMSLSSFAQGNGIDKYFEEYQDDERFTRISISSRMFGLFAKLDDPQGEEAEQEFVETISTLRGLKILAADSLPEAKEIYKLAVKAPSRDMEELMIVESKGQELRFFIREADGVITELLMVSYEGESLMMMSLIGNIDLERISKLSKRMSIDGFEHLENVGQ